jgi:hypothetical protein
MTELQVLKSQFNIHCVSGDEDVIIAFTYSKEIAEYMIQLLAGQKWDKTTLFYWEEVTPVERISAN